LIEDAETVSLYVRVPNTDNRVFMDSLRPSAYAGQTPEILVARSLPLAELRTAVKDQTVAIGEDVYLRFNWSGSDVEVVREIVQQVLARYG